MGKRKYFAINDAPVKPIKANIAGQRKLVFQFATIIIKAVVMAMGTSFTKSFVAICAGISKLFCVVLMVNPFQLGYQNNTTDIINPICHDAIKKV